MRDFIGRGGTLGVVAMGAVLASLAMAPAAGAATYHGCVSKKSDVLRLVSISKKCKKGEERISFNSQGPPGRNGSNGQNGANGANGTNGTDGTTGFTSTLPSGKTELGTWSGDLGEAATTGVSYSSISFDIPLAAPPESSIIGLGGSSTPECPGTVAKPSASSGHLCIYTAQLVSANEFQFDPNQVGGSPGADVFGTIVVLSRTASGLSYGYGTWAVTG